MEKFKIYDIDVPVEHTLEIGKFAGGEIRVKITPQGFEGCISNNIRISATLLNSDDVMTLVMIVDALREAGVENIRLTMPYIPYARQDRVCNKGEALSIRAFANIINALDFKSVVVWDAHSVISTTLIKNCINVPQSDLICEHVELMKWLTESTDPIYLIAPDAGSVHKATKIARTYPTLIRDVLYAEKTRELSTGKIIATRITSDIPDDFSESKVLICDDICDFGTTFVELSKVLQEYNPKEVSLYVTHGIFSGGKDRMFEYFDNVWCSLDFEYTWSASLNKYTN